MIHTRDARAALGSLLVVALAGALAGCCRYDAELHATLEATRGHVVGAAASPGLYDRFAEPALPADLVEVQASVDHIRDLAEQQRGRFCWEISRQGAAIKQMFDRHVTDRRAGGPWNATKVFNAKQNIAEAFDIALRTLAEERDH